MGERVQTTNSNHPHDWFAIPIIPLNNIYSSLLLPLLFAKLRTATIVIDYTYRSSSYDLFENAQTLFRQCLKLNRISIERYVNIDYECLLHLARIDRLHKRTAVPLKNIVQQLLHAIQLCYLSSNDGQFIQTCYFELALVFLEYSRLSTDTATRKPSVKSLILADTSSILKQQPRTTTLNVANDTAKKQQSKQAAAVAIRAATQMAINQKHRYESKLFSSIDSLS